MRNPNKPVWIKKRVKPGTYASSLTEPGSASTKREVLKKWRYAANQDWTYLHGRPRREVAMRINYAIGPNKKVLELAAGEMQHVKDAVVSDFSRDMLYRNPAEKRLLFDLNDIAKGKRLPFKPKSFDSVILTYGINYIKDQQRAIKEIARLLKQNGKIILFGGRFSGLDGVPKYGYSPPHLKEMLEKEGFKVHMESMFEDTVFIEAGRNLDVRQAEKDSEAFKARQEKRTQRESKQLDARKKIVEERPKKFQSTTDYWEARVVFDRILSTLKKRGVNAVIESDDSAVNAIRSEQSMKSVRGPWQINFSIVTEKEAPEETKKLIKSIVEKEITKEYGEQKWKHLTPWRAERGRPWNVAVKSRAEFEKKRKEVKEKWGDRYIQ